MKTSKQINTEIVARLKSAGFKQDEHGSQTYSKFDDRLLIVKFSTRSGQTSFECSDAGIKANFSTLDECFDFFSKSSVNAYIDAALADDESDTVYDDLEHTSSQILASKTPPLHSSLEPWKIAPMVEVEGKRYPIISAAEHDKQQAALDALRNGVEAVKALEKAGYTAHELGFKKELAHAELRIVEGQHSKDWAWYVHKSDAEKYAESTASTVHEAIKKADEAALEIDSEWKPLEDKKHNIYNSLSSIGVLFLIAAAFLDGNSIARHVALFLSLGLICAGHYHKFVTSGIYYWFTDKKEGK